MSFSNNAPDPERDSAAVQQFLVNMEAAFRAHPLWAGCSEEELESAGEVSFFFTLLSSILNVSYRVVFLIAGQTRIMILLLLLLLWCNLRPIN